MHTMYYSKSVSFLHTAHIVHLFRCISYADRVVNGQMGKCRKFVQCARTYNYICVFCVRVLFYSSVTKNEIILHTYTAQIHWHSPTPQWSYINNSIMMKIRKIWRKNTHKIQRKLRSMDFFCSWHNFRHYKYMHTHCQSHKRM